MTFRVPLTLLAALVLTPNVAGGQRAQPARLTTFDPQSAAQLKWRYIGPVGNRVASVVGVPGDPHVHYAGAASGGLWQTVDAGIHWAPIFDDLPVPADGALAAAPSNAHIVWAGTGEPWSRGRI